MNLPNAANAVVKRPTIIAYLLAPEHPEGAGKAEFLGRFGFTADPWEILADALLNHARTHPFASVSDSPYGAKYRIEGPLVCPDGRTPRVI